MIPKIKRLLDLTQDIYHACPAWPTHKFTNFNYEAQIATHGYNAERIEMNTHTGTHMDAPFHFLQDGKKLEQIDLHQVIGRGIAIDLRDIDSMAIEEKHLSPYSEKIKENDIILLYTGWAQKRGMNKEYLNEWPYITESAAAWLIEKQIKCVCTDGLSVGGWPEGTGRPPHIVLLNSEIVIIEELYMDEELFTEDEWFVIALPTKLKGVGGSPTRVIALVFE